MEPSLFEIQSPTAADRICGLAVSVTDSMQAPSSRLSVETDDLDPDRTYHRLLWGLLLVSWVQSRVVRMRPLLGMPMI